MKVQKTKYIKVRMTLEEVEQFKKKAKEYKTVSHYVRRALEEYSNMNIRQQIELMNDRVHFTESIRMNCPGQEVT